MKVAISIPDELFEDAEHLVKQLGVSRSKLYARAVSEFVQAHDDQRITDQLNRVYEQNAEVGPEDNAALAAGLDTLRRAEW